MLFGAMLPYMAQISTRDLPALTPLQNLEASRLDRDQSVARAQAPCCSIMFAATTIIMEVREIIMASASSTTAPT